MNCSPKHLKALLNVSEAKRKRDLSVCLPVLFLTLCHRVRLLGHISQRSEMPVGLRGREVDKSPPDVWIRNNSLFRQLSSLIPPDWPLV